MPKTKHTKKVATYSLDIKVVDYIEKQAKKAQVFSKSVFVNDTLLKAFKMDKK